MQGRLIIFEGIDHVGKSTLVDEVKNAYICANKEVKVFQFPGKEEGTLGKLVYDIHHNKMSIKEITPLSLQLLHIAAHIDLLKQKILSLLEGGYDVLLDRYWWSTVAYGIAGGVNRTEIEKIISIEKDITDKINNKIIFYIIRKNRENDYGQNIERIILEEYNKLYDEYRGIKYIIHNDGNIQTTTQIILDKLEINK